MKNRSMVLGALCAGLMLPAAGARAQYYFDAEAEPYLRVRVGRRFAKSDVSFLAAPQGRAKDTMLAVIRQMGPGLRLRAGYRFLEGGSGAGEVYTFAWLHYLLAGLTWEF